MPLRARRGPGVGSKRRWASPRWTPRFPAGPTATGLLWAIFPTRRTTGFRAATVELAASQAVRLVCGPSSLELRAGDGKLRVRGKDVGLRGARVVRLHGGTIKMN